MNPDYTNAPDLLTHRWSYDQNRWVPRSRYIPPVVAPPPDDPTEDRIDYSHRERMGEYRFERDRETT